ASHASLHSHNDRPHRDLHSFPTRRSSDLTHIKSAVLTGRKAGKAQSEFLTFSLSDVLVSGYQTGGATADAPLDSISLNFSKIEMTYREQTAKGSPGPSIRVGWDRKTNKAF